MIDTAGLRLGAERHDDLAIPRDLQRLFLKSLRIDVEVPRSVQRVPRSAELWTRMFLSALSQDIRDFFLQCLLLPGDSQPFGIWMQKRVLAAAWHDLRI